MKYKQVFRCLYVFSKLGEINEFTGYYVSNRKSQNEILAEGENDVKSNDPTVVLTNFYEKIVGFFLIEDYIFQNTKRKLFLRTEINEMWNFTMDKANAFTLKRVEQFESESKLKEFVKFLKLFSDTIKLFNLPSSSINQTIEKLTYVYANKLLAITSEKLCSLLVEDGYKPTVINSPLELENLVLTHGLSIDINQRGLQMSLDNFRSVTCAFTVAVPKFCDTVKMFAKELYEFIAALREKEDLLIQMLNQLIKGTAHAILNNVVTWYFLHILQLDFLSYLNCLLQERKDNRCFNA